MVLPSTAQAETRSAQIAAHLGRDAAEIRAYLHTFRSLTAEILRGAPDDRRAIGRAFQRLILTDIVRTHLRADDYLGRMIEAPGFAGALTEKIREWKLACLTPDLLNVAAEPTAEHLKNPTFARKARELARLFGAYETFLSHNRMRDEEDLLLAAAGRAGESGQPLQGRPLLLIADGFYRFHPAQRRLLAALAGRGLQRRPAEEGKAGEAEIEVAVTLPWETERALLFAAPERTRQALHTEFDCQEIALSSPPSRPAPLSRLASRLYGEPMPGRKEENESATESGPVLLFDAPNPYVEAEMAAREFRRMHDREGIAWSDFTVVLRTLGDYTPILAAVFERYGVPLGVDGPETLAENPLVKTLLHLLAVVRHGWQRDEVLAFLKSSYTAPDKLAADDLRRRARRKGVRAGREQWLQLVSDAPESALAVTLREMARIDTALTSEEAGPDTLADAIREGVDGFGLQARIELGEPARRERDHAALQGALEILDALQELFTLSRNEAIARGRSEPFSFALFHARLASAWQSGAAIAAPEGDRVHVTEPYDTRDRPIRVAAVMGLTERVFPRRITEDPFLRDEERAALWTVGGIELEPQKLRADDERFLFYLAITAPSDRLILSYPRADDESDTLPSFYLDEVRAALQGGRSKEEAPLLRLVSRTLADVAPRHDEAVTPADRLLAACADLFDPAGAEGPGSVALAQAARAHLRECLGHEEGDGLVRAVVASRLKPPLPRLEALELRAAFAAHRDVFTAGELEAFGRCPFQYLLRHVLHLRPEPDATDPQVQENLLRAVLRRGFRRQMAAGAEGEPLKQTLHGQLDRTLSETPLDLSPHRLSMTRRLLADALGGVTKREERFAPQFGMQPAYIHLAFGTQDGGAALDPASRAEPLLLHPEDGGSPVAVRGVMDRVDLDASGHKALILEFMLGRPPEFAAMEQGISLKLPLHLLALERIWGLEGAAACHDSARETGRRRFFRTEHVGLKQFGPVLPLEEGRSVTPQNREQFTKLSKTAEATAIRLARAIAAGGVEATPGEHCRLCPYTDVCRTTALGGHDGEREAL